MDSVCYRAVLFSYKQTVDEYRKAAVDAVQKLSVDVGITTKLDTLKEEDLQFLAESAHADACAPGNPVFLFLIICPDNALTQHLSKKIKKTF